MKCQFEDCDNEYDIRTAITDKETLRDIFICKECYIKLNGSEQIYLSDM